MAITLTSDAIITAADAEALLSWEPGPELTLAINSVSARFLKFTGRQRITSGALVQTEALPPAQVPTVYLRAAPVDTGETFTVEVYQDGASVETLTDSDYDLEDVGGRLFLNGHNSTGNRSTRRLVISYTGGWSTVPGDVVESAVHYMRLNRRRRDGMVGASSVSSDSTATATVSNIGNIPPEVADVWQAYKVY